MIDANGNYMCDYCQNELGSGEYFTATGNHVLCQDRARMTARIAELEAQLSEAVYIINEYLSDHTDNAYLMDNPKCNCSTCEKVRAAEFLNQEAE